MPVPAVIAAAAENYRFNSDFLTRTVQDLSPDEWLSRPNDNTNHIAWIVGHVIWARKAVPQPAGNGMVPTLALLVRAWNQMQRCGHFPIAGDTDGKLGTKSREFWPPRSTPRQRMCLAGLREWPSKRRRKDQRSNQLPRHPRDLPRGPGIVSAQLDGPQRPDGASRAPAHLLVAIFDRPRFSMQETPRAAFSG